MRDGGSITPNCWKGSMAKIKELWRCTGCGALYETQPEAVNCAKTHVRKELWAVGKGHSAYQAYAPKSPSGCEGSIAWALRKADEQGKT